MDNDDFEHRFAEFLEKVADDADELIISVAPLELKGQTLPEVAILSLCGGDGITISADVLEAFLNHDVLRKSRLKIRLDHPRLQSPSPGECS